MSAGFKPICFLSVSQVRLRGRHPVHLQSGPRGPALRRLRNLPLPEVRRHSEGAGHAGRQTVPGLHRSRHLLLLAQAHRILRPAVQDQRREVEPHEAVSVSLKDCGNKDSTDTYF